MKKLVLSICLLIVGCLLVGCGSSSSNIEFKKYSNEVEYTAFESALAKAYEESILANELEQDFVYKMITINDVTNGSYQKVVSEYEVDYDKVVFKLNYDRVDDDRNGEKKQEKDVYYYYIPEGETRTMMLRESDGLSTRGDKTMRTLVSDISWKINDIPLSAVSQYGRFSKCYIDGNVYTIILKDDALSKTYQVEFSKNKISMVMEEYSNKNNIENSSKSLYEVTLKGVNISKKFE